MPSLTISDETFRRLSERASALNLSIDDVMKSALDRLDEAPSAWPGMPPLTGDAWWSEFEAMTEDARRRADRYSPGFALDDSRETMYREREDAQL